MRIVGGVTRRVARGWRTCRPSGGGVTFSTWPARGVLNGAPVDLRALERAAAVVRPGVGEGVRDWQELASSTGEGGAPGLVWDVRGFYFGSADPHGVGGIDAVRLPRKRATEPHLLPCSSLNDAMDRALWAPPILLRLAQVASGMMVLKAVAPCWRSFKIALARSRVFRPDARAVFISKHVRAALQRWATELEDPEHVGVPMACREWVPAYGAPGVGVIYADASGEEGWAAWTFVSGVVYMVSGVWGELDRELIIADKELVASTVGLFVLGEALHFKYVW
jgi:hypothetical protein